MPLLKFAAKWWNNLPIFNFERLTCGFEKCQWVFIDALWKRPLRKEERKERRDGQLTEQGKDRAKDRKII